MGFNCNSIQTAAQAASVGFAKGDDMSDELVKRLRGMEVITTPGQPFSLATAGPWLKHNAAMRQEAAARIAALTAERDAERARADRAEMLVKGQEDQLEIQGNELCHRAAHGHQLAARVKELEGESDSFQAGRRVAKAIDRRKQAVNTGDDNG